MDAALGDTVIMPCNSTPSSGVMWVQNSTDGHYGHIYSNFSIRNDQSRFSVISASAGDYSLKISNVHLIDSGLYDCYEASGSRIIGYYLVVEGTSIDVLKATV